jgi:methylenetetrahydrofolate dehydrogenase (NADP+)/methenyltetrahydrofolate cyclohydrolase
VLLELVAGLNRDPEVHGVLVQLPLPRHIDPEVIVEAIDPLKDVDGFHAVTLGRLFRGTPTFLPCTPAGVVDLIRSTGQPLRGREAVIIGRSLIVGRPLAHLLLAENMTVTVCHSQTRDLPSVARRGDLLVAAVGRADMVSGDFIRPGAIVIDVGINRNPEGKLTGDVAYEQALDKAGYITPVPGGVGPMTIAMLLRNVLKAATLQFGAGTPHTT